MTQPGFSFIDVLVAILLSFTGMLGLLATQTAVARHDADAKVSQRAWNLLASAKTLSLEQLMRLPDRGFDAQGQPTSAEPYYLLNITQTHEGEEGEDLLVLEIQVRWQCKDQARELIFHRKEWYPYVQESLQPH